MNEIIKDANYIKLLKLHNEGYEFRLDDYCDDYKIDEWTIKASCRNGEGRECSWNRIRPCYYNCINDVQRDMDWCAYVDRFIMPRNDIIDFHILKEFNVEL